jgi:hypothetical protein
MQRNLLGEVVLQKAQGRSNVRGGSALCDFSSSDLADRGRPTLALVTPKRSGSCTESISVARASRCEQTAAQSLALRADGDQPLWIGCRSTRRTAQTLTQGIDDAEGGSSMAVNGCLEGFSRGLRSTLSNLRNHG